MKKTLSTLGLLAGIVGAAQAQEARFGIKAGVSLANVAGTTDGRGFSNLVGANAGVMADFSLSDLISVHPELLFSQKGAKFSQSDASGASLSGQGRFTCLDLPVLLRVKADGLFFEAGPQLGYLLAVKNEQTVSVPGLSSESSSSTSKEGARRLDFGYVAGVGYQLPQGLEFGVRYNGCISDLADPSKGSKIRNSVFQFQVGYLFGGN